MSAQIISPRALTRLQNMSRVIGFCHYAKFFFYLFVRMFVVRASWTGTNTRFLVLKVIAQVNGEKDEKNTLRVVIEVFSFPAFLQWFSLDNMASSRILTVMFVLQTTRHKVGTDKLARQASRILRLYLSKGV